MDVYGHSSNPFPFFSPEYSPQTKLWFSHVLDSSSFWATQKLGASHSMSHHIQLILCQSSGYVEARWAIWAYVGPC